MGEQEDGHIQEAGMAAQRYLEEATMGPELAKGNRYTEINLARS